MLTQISCMFFFKFMRERERERERRERERVYQLNYCTIK